MSVLSQDEQTKDSRTAHVTQETDDTAVSVDSTEHELAKDLQQKAVLCEGTASPLVEGVLGPLQDTHNTGSDVGSERTATTICSVAKTAGSTTFSQTELDEELERQAAEMEPSTVMHGASTEDPARNPDGDTIEESEPNLPEHAQSGQKQATGKKKKRRARRKKKEPRRRQQGDEATQEHSRRRNNPREHRTQKTHIYIAKFPLHWDEQKLNDLFSEFGTITHCKCLRDRLTDEARGCGFVHFLDEESADKAVAAMDGHIPEGPGRTKALEVRKALLRGSGRMSRNRRQRQRDWECMKRQPAPMDYGIYGGPPPPISEHMRYPHSPDGNPYANPYFGGNRPWYGPSHHPYDVPSPPPPPPYASLGGNPYAIRPGFRPEPMGPPAHYHHPMHPPPLPPYRPRPSPYEQHLHYPQDRYPGEGPPPVERMISPPAPREHRSGSFERRVDYSRPAPEELDSPPTSSAEFSIPRTLEYGSAGPGRRQRRPVDTPPPGDMGGTDIATQTLTDAMQPVA